MKLSDITENTQLIKDFKQRLAKSAGEAIVATIINKVKRTSGVSTLPIDFNLENGQKVTIYARIIDDKADIFRVDVNDKQMPTSTDMDFDPSYKPSFNKSVDMVGKFVTSGAAAFEKKRAAIKVAPVKSKNTSLSITKKIAAFQQQADELAQQIELKSQEKKGLEDKLASLQNNQLM